MSKNKKGKKMGLGEFLGQEYGNAQTKGLPRGPQQRDPDDDGRFDRRDNRSRDRGRREDADPDEGRGDAADQWRRAPPPRSSDRQSDRGFGSSFNDRDRGFGSGDRDRGFRDRDRGFGGDRDRDRGGEVGRSEGDNDWRRGGAEPTGSSFGGRDGGRDNFGRADEASNWRSAAPAAPPAAAEDERPRLKLTKKGEYSDKENETKSEALNGNTETSTASDEAPKAPEKSTEENKSTAEATTTKEPVKKSGGDKWDSIFAGSSSSSGRRMFGDDKRDMERENAFYSSSRRSGDDRRDAYSSFGSNDRFRRDPPPTNDRFRRDDPPSSDRFRRDDPPSSDRFRRDDPPSSDRFRRDEPPRYRRDDPPRSESYRREEPRERDSGLRAADRKLLTKSRVASWADPDDDADRPRLFAKKEEPKKQAKSDGAVDEDRELSAEDVASRVFTITKDFYVMQQTKVAMKEIKSKLVKSKTGKTVTFQQPLIKELVSKMSPDEIVEIKICARLIEQLVKEEVVAKSDVGSVLDEVVGKVDNDALMKLVKVWDGLLDGVELAEATMTALKIERGNTGDVEAEVEKVAKAMVANGTKGKALLDLVKICDTPLSSLTVEQKLSIGLKLVEEIYKSNADTIFTETSATTYLSADQYGPVLAKLIYIESPTRKELPLLVGIITHIQECFSKVKFPKTAKGGSILEKVFMGLYKAEVLGEEAFIGWKETVDESAGKLDAIVQTTRFINFLEEEDSDSEEEESEDDE